MRDATVFGDRRFESLDGRAKDEMLLLQKFSQRFFNVLTDTLILALQVDQWDSHLILLQTHKIGGLNAKYS